MNSVRPGAAGASRLSLRQRLMLAFGLVVFLIVVSMGLLWKLGVESRHDVAQARTDALGNAALADAQSAVWALRWGVAQYLTLSDAAAREKLVAASTGLRADFDKSVQGFGQGLDDDVASKAKLDELRTAFARYAEARLAFFRLMGDGKTEEATQLRAERLTPAGAATNKAFAELIDLQRKTAAQRADEAVAAQNFWSRLSLAIMLTAVAVAAVAGALVTRSVLRQLGGDPTLAVAAAQRIAAGDLVTPVEASVGDSSSLLAAMRSMQTALRGVIDQVRGGAESVASASEEIAQGTQDLSGRTEQQAGSLQQAASTMDQLESTVRQNADSARQADQLARSAAEVARQGGDVVGQVVQTMKGIDESSKRIADIIGTIDGIAFQTNILALNAAVEAARAGEQGRGFAVVAGEVRSLAQRSAEAAREIKSLIGASVERVGHGSALVEQAGTTMQQVVASIQRVTDIVAEITSASGEQAAGVAQVAQSVTEMDGMTQQNSALVEQSAAAAAGLRAQAQQLLQTVAAFRMA